MDVGSKTSVQAIQTQLSKNFDKAFQQDVGDAFKDVYETIPSSSGYTLYSMLGWVPSLVEYNKGEKIIQANMERQEKLVKNKKFGLKIPIPMEDVQDNMLSEYSRLSSGLAYQAKIKVQSEVAKLFLNGFTTATTYDDLSWFNDSHTVGVSTIDNAMTSALSATSFETAYETITGFTFQATEASDLEPLNPNHKLVLLVAPTNYLTAKAIVENEKDNYGATNELYGLAEVRSVPWLASQPNYWYLVNVGTPTKPCAWQMRENAKLVSKNAQNSDECEDYDQLSFSVRIRGAAFACCPWLAVGSTGAVAGS
jgi:phage major head subunit gpT-like protein